ncbi:Phage integrase family protein [Roseovarius lutimaris]|uniref:Phage integrase family protein n=1 Tax=Roseovarius lutimaris TaxID=1005928 RepID=A0A1I4Z2A2_9RHOB|nr:Phage integrase family protein [Roseovarius lutimaris]
MRSFSVKHVKTDNRNGHYIYRRRVPKALLASIGKTEFVSTLGRTEGEALVAYGPYHERIEHILALAKNGVTGLSPTEQRERLKAMLEGWGADPHGPGPNLNEQTWREEAAAKLVDRYQNPDTGRYEGVPEKEAAMASALLGGVSKETPEPTITDAFKFYLTENVKSLPEQRKKQEQRLDRAKRHLIAAVGSDKFISKLTREDARKWRGIRMAGGVTVSTIKREKNDISAVIGVAQSELDAGGVNPFLKLKFQKTTVSRQDEREALPAHVIEGVYDALSKKRPDLLPIWTLLDFTGARPSEIRQLQVGEIILDHPVPHIVINERNDRTLKTSWSNRQVPLVGAALKAAVQAVKGVNDQAAPAFPRFYGEGGMDRLSQALKGRIRALTKNKRHVPYSLRHNMKDRMRAAEIFPDTQKAIQGHALGRGEDASYGGPVSLEQKRDALVKALGEHRESRQAGRE